MSRPAGRSGTVAEVVADGLCYPECPRWHDDRLVFSDQYGEAVHQLDADGRTPVVAHVPGRPAGLGWHPDGALVVVSMLDRRVLVARDPQLLAGDDLEVLADLGDASPGPTNELLIGPTGLAYVGNIGFDFYGGEAPRPTHLLAVAVDGTVEVAAEDLLVPNGMGFSPDGARLLVAESFAHRLTSFAVDDDGSLHDRRTFAELGDHIPDGIAVDAGGGVWFASVTTGACHRVEAGGRLTHEVGSADRAVFACALGGDGGRTLFLCTSRTHEPAEAVALRSGAIEVVEVDLPAAPPARAR